MGELHLDIIRDRLDREFRVQCRVGRPQVAYRETVRVVAVAEHVLKRQIGGRGQFAHVIVEVGPGIAGSSNVVSDHSPAGVIPKEFIKPALDGAREALERGALAGYPLVGAALRLVGGSFTVVDSSDVAFRIAASMAVQDAVQKASPVLLEPIMAVEISVPEEYTGAVTGDLSGRRGSVTRMESLSGMQVIGAEVPLSSLFGYATDLRSATKGRASFVMQFHQYAEVPDAVSKEIVARLRGY